MLCSFKILFVKLKSVLLLSIIFTCLILLITIVSHRPSILRGETYKYSINSNYPKRAPGSFLQNYKPKNESYCKFNYNLPEEFLYDENELRNSPELGVHSSYKVLYNVIEVKQNYDSTALLTYATHVTPDFLRYISEIVRYWDGLVSLAAFVPDFDADIVTKQLITLCHCLPEMSKLSVHYIFPQNKPPFIGNNGKSVNDCNITETSNVITYRYQNKLIYPVNVCRNVARQAATTEYILVSDVELIPSEKLASNFLDMIERKFRNTHFKFPSKVFVLPVFEINTYIDIPRRKGQIRQLVNEERAVYFHRHVCSHCQRFPGLEQWLKKENEEMRVSSHIILT